MKTIGDDIDFLAFIGKQESQFIAKASEFGEGVLSRFRGDDSISGDLLPWSKSHQLVALRPGEVSVWAGVNGHGKSQLLGQVCAWNLANSKWLMASMEMKPAATMYRMIRQMAGMKTPSDQYVNRLLKWTDEKLWIYDQLDTVKAERILGMVHYAAQVLKVNHIIIDSLMKCGIGTDDYNAQKAFVDRLCWAAKTENIHIHLVHHIRKGEKESTIPDKFDIRGAAEITDLVDNVFIVHRNKSKEAKRVTAKFADQIFDESSEPDCTLKIAKQRHGEWEGAFNLWFHPDSYQYVPKPENRPMTFFIGEQKRAG